ncbi:MAG: D-alanyl-D-alanine carboxypeptidase/D-alanyl-D-alanine-endopeptidase [Prolixibacteraceae bacterium]|nr:D-alanyl-D-alanine carboxypeptidase/D-alanyl-D-alanine-endopeptidase [Prolixibacteraceae bacterium]
MQKTIYLLFFMSNVYAALAQPGQELLKHFTNNPDFKQAPISISVRNCNTGEELMPQQSSWSITPASVLKLVTSATALEVLGKDFRFETKVGYAGSMTQKTLQGKLIVLAGGDPSLGSAYFHAKDQKHEFLSSWAQKIKLSGIDTIRGNIEIDQSIYPDRDVPRSWIWEDLGNYYGAVAGPIALYDNTFELVFQTASNKGGPAVIIDTLPKIPGLIVQNEVVSSNDQRDMAYVFGSPFDSFRVIKGTLPVNKASFRIRASIPDPAALLVQDLKQALEEIGVVIIPADYSSPSFQSNTILFTHESPPLSELIKVINHESMNLCAEHLCKHLGLVLNGTGTTEAGVKAIVNYWKNRGIDTEFFFMADGSGLSRANAISAETLVNILIEMKSSRYFEDYLSSIPLTGLEGTMQFYFHDSFLKGKAHAKSGSMTRVRSFAGYMTTRTGTPLAFAIMVNNFSGSSMDTAKKMEELMENIYLQL